MRHTVSSASSFRPFLADLGVETAVELLENGEANADSARKGFVGVSDAGFSFSSKD
jgi:hypothetical protein